MKKQFLEAGKIVGTHGIRGELRVQSWCETQEAFCKLKTLYFDGGKTAVNVKSSRIHKNIVLVTLDGIDTLEKAEQKIISLNKSNIVYFYYTIYYIPLV